VSKASRFARARLATARFATAAALALLLGCGGEPETPATSRDAGAAAAETRGEAGAAADPDAPAAPPAAAGDERAEPGPRDAPLVVFLGDSLTAGYGLAAEEAFPALVAERLASSGTPIAPVNAGVSGDTSAGGLRRLPWLLRQRPDVLVVELGANDALRGQPVPGIEENLRRIVVDSRAAGASVLLVGLQVPPSYGPAYAREFAAMYPRLAEELEVPLLPFLLEGVAGRRELNLADGIHPNAEGHRRIAELLAPRLADLLDEGEDGAGRRRAAAAGGG
jgi:acyl-CoA thioesterase-1